MQYADVTTTNEEKSPIKMGNDYVTSFHSIDFYQLICPLFKKEKKLSYSSSVEPVFCDFGGKSDREEMERATVLVIISLKFFPLHDGELFL